MYNYSTYCCTEEFPMCFSFMLYGLTSCIFSFVFYGSIEAITEVIHRWFHFLKYRQCLITAPIIPTACLRARYSSYAFTRSIHRPLLTRHCTNYLFTKLWLIRGGASVYRPRSPLQYKRQSPPSKRAYDTIRISCPQTRLTRAIKLVRTNNFNKIFNH